MQAVTISICNHKHTHGKGGVKLKAGKGREGTAYSKKGKKWEKKGRKVLWFTTALTTEICPFEREEKKEVFPPGRDSERKKKRERSEREDRFHADKRDEGKGRRRKEKKLSTNKSQINEGGVLFQGQGKKTMKSSFRGEEKGKEKRGEGVL